MSQNRAGTHQSNGVTSSTFPSLFKNLMGPNQVAEIRCNGGASSAYYHAPPFSNRWGRWREQR